MAEEKQSITAQAQEIILDYSSCLVPTQQMLSWDDCGGVTKCGSLLYVARNGYFMELSEFLSSPYQPLKVTLGYQLPIGARRIVESVSILPHGQRELQIDGDAPQKLEELLQNPIHARIEEYFNEPVRHYKDIRHAFIAEAREISTEQDDRKAVQEAVSSFLNYVSRHGLIKPWEYELLEEAGYAAGEMGEQITTNKSISHTAWHQHVEKFANVASDYFNFMLYDRLQREKK